MKTLHFNTSMSFAYQTATINTHMSEIWAVSITFLLVPALLSQQQFTGGYTLFIRDMKHHFWLYVYGIEKLW